MARSTDGLHSRAAKGLGKLFPSGLEMYRSNAIATFPPAESPDVTTLDAGMFILRRYS